MSTPGSPDTPAQPPVFMNALDGGPSRTFGLSDERHFRRAVEVEMRRSERSGRPFLLVTIDIGDVLRRLNGGFPGIRRNAFARVFASTIVEAMRETDACGWLVDRRIAGALCVEASEADADAVTSRIQGRLQETFGPEKAALVRIERYAYPAFVNTGDGRPPLPPHVHDWIAKRTVGKKIQHAAKRLIDITGSVCAIVLFSPILLTIPILVKLTSPGPAIFRQYRVGRGGRKFLFYKFRSMHLNSDDKIHREFVANLIKGAPQKAPDGREIFKIENDPRITPIGRLIRKASIDELPQLFNVLKGDMSLVGPRPAICYEVEQYESWHLARVMCAKPGITGLWQVEGRSRTTFEAMTRMDVRYARRWSVWWDIALIVKTPFSVLTARGAH